MRWRSVRTFVYNPTAASFSLSGDEEKYSAEITPTSLCSVGELAQALARYDPQLEQYAYYLSALILSQKSDFPVPENDPPVFAAIDVVQSWPDGDLKNLATNLMRFRNVLKVLFDGGDVDGIVASHGAMFGQYAPALANVCATVFWLERAPRRARGRCPKGWPAWSLNKHSCIHGISCSPR